MKTIFSCLTIIATLFIFGCSISSENKSTGTDALASHIDSTVKPGDDFFLFANGKWFKQNPIPASEAGNGLWQLIQDTIDTQIKNICVSSASLTNAPKGSNKQKIGDFYYSGMDSVVLNKKGISDIKNDLDRIDAVADIKTLIKEAAYSHKFGGSPLFSIYVSPDDKISSKNAVLIYQGGLSLPNRDYYFDTDGRAQDVRRKFVDYAGNMFKIMGYNDAKATRSAKNLMKLETALAKVSRKLEDTRDPLLNYNKMTFKQLIQTTPEMQWQVFMEEIGLSKVDSVIIGQPEYLVALNNCLKTFPLNDWKDYLKFQLLTPLSFYLDDKTYALSFGFYSTSINGIEEPKPRWKRVVSETDGSLGELIGQVYITEYLPKGTKEKLLEIGIGIKEVYAERIKALDWMSDTTKAKALNKLNSVILKVGYPDKWKDLSSLQIDRSSYVKNVMNAYNWAFQYMISKYGKPVDRTEWQMHPQDYNAYYNPSNNEIVVPGCNIIVPGYERVLADDAILYSIIGGSTIGHEITHGFDDQGCKYNEKGNLNNWWMPEDSVKFYSKTRLIIKQFNEFVAVDSLHVNGKLTQGENIADLGGIIMGYEAFKKTKQYKNKERIAGLTADQRFFLAYAYAWMINQRPEYIANQVRSDVHSPAKFRVLGPLANMPEFYAVMGIKKGDAMWMEDSLRVKIW